MQVEFVAVPATLFMTHRVRLGLQRGESMEDGKRNLLRRVNDSARLAITLQMQAPRDVELVSVKRD